MLKTFSKSLAALFAAAVLMLGLPALSFADEDTSGGGKSLSEFTDVDWDTVTLSFGQSEFSVKEADCDESVKPENINGLKLYVEKDGSLELISASEYSYETFPFYGDAEGTEYLSNVRESGTYYIKVELKDAASSIRYVPVSIKIIDTDIYDLSIYYLEDEAECDFRIGDEVLKDTKSALAKVSFDLFCSTFESMHNSLPDDATYEVDSTWYQCEDDSYTPMDSYPKKYGSYAIRIIGSGKYSGEHYIRFTIPDPSHSSSFSVSSPTCVSLDQYKTVSELKNSIEISTESKDESENAVLNLGEDYEIPKIGIENLDYEGDEEDDEAWTLAKDSDPLQSGRYRVWIKPIGKYYGDAVTEYIYLINLKDLESYKFNLSTDYGHNLLLLNSDSFNISGLKVTSECESIEDAAALVQGTDFELDNTWYQYDDESGEYSAIEGSPKSEGWYRIPVTGKGDFNGKIAYMRVYVVNEFDLNHYSISTKRYLVAGEGLALSKLNPKVYGSLWTDSTGDDDSYGVGRTLTYGQDYTICWGEYDSNGVFQSLDEGGYPEVTEDTDNWCLKVVGQGNYSGQEIIERQYIHKDVCTHSRVYKEDEIEPTCTEDGSTGGSECSDCGEILTEPTVVDALGHDWKKVEGTERAATCTEDGKEADEECSRCGEVKQGAAIKAEDGVHDYQKIANSAIEPTCTSEGKEADEKCSNCGDIIEGKTINKIGHKYDEGTVTTPATCGAEGVKTYTCTVCNETKTEKIPATGKHTPKVTKAAVAASYTATGLTEEKVCADCGIVLQKQSVIAKLSAKAQSVNVKTATKTVKKAKVKKKAQTVSGAIKVTGAKGKVTYAKASGSGKLKINASNGKITVKKKTKKGTYSIKVRVNVAASADGQFKAYSKTITVKVKVK